MIQVMNCEKTNVLLLHVQGVKGVAVGRGVEIKGKGAELTEVECRMEHNCSW